MTLPRSAWALLCSVLVLPASAGCVADAGDAGEGDEELVESSEDAVQGGQSNFGYFIVTRRDMRKCMAPLCGGFFVKRVNSATTRCADGTLSPECYVESIRLGGTKLSPREESAFRGALEAGRALVKARMFKTRFNGATLGTLKADEAWLGATGSTPDGTFYRVADNGVRCIQAPCPSQTAAPLNGVGEPYDVIDVRLDATALPATGDLLSRATNAIGTAQGILIAGGIALPKCIAGSSCGPLAFASEFYVRITRREGRSCGGFVVDPSASACNDGQYCRWAQADICGAADASGTCAYKPDMCPQVYTPVCACDGKTYGNACSAAAAGYSVSSVGACQN